MSLCHLSVTKLSKLVEILLSSDKNNFANFFTHVYCIKLTVIKLTLIKHNTTMFRVQIERVTKVKKIFNSKVKAVLLYASKSWTITQKTVDRLQVFFINIMNIKTKTAHMGYVGYKKCNYYAQSDCSKESNYN